MTPSLDPHSYSFLFVMSSEWRLIICGCENSFRVSSSFLFLVSLLQDLSLRNIVIGVVSIREQKTCQFRIGRLIDWFGITFDLCRILWLPDFDKEPLTISPIRIAVGDGILNSYKAIIPLKRRQISDAGTRSQLPFLPLIICTCLCAHMHENSP